MRFRPSTLAFDAGTACRGAESGIGRGVLRRQDIEMLVGALPGGGWGDIWARAVAKHLGRHIPGEPAVVVKNMPGAGSARWRSSSAAWPDGTAIARRHAGAIMGPLLDDRTAPLFDPTKLNYVGTANSGTRVCVTLKGSENRQSRDAQRVKAVSAAARPTTPDRVRLPARNTAGAIYDIVPGYRGARICARDRSARRDRRHLRLGLVELQIAEAGLAARQQGQRAAPGLDRAASRAHQDGCATVFGT